MQPFNMVHPDVYGLPALRAEIAAYLQIARGIGCSPSQVFVTSGYRHTVELIAHALLKAGDRVWLENPGYPPTRELLIHMSIAALAWAETVTRIAETGIPDADYAAAAAEFSARCHGCCLVSPACSRSPSRSP
jgi:GntR family transcriptional regulator/MocR family aminotransferase